MLSPALASPMTATPALAAFADAVHQRVGSLDRRAGDVLAAGLAAADPYPPTRDALDELAGPAAVAVACGKAAVPMARAWQDWGGPPGVVVAPEGTEPEGLDGWEVRWGEHPVPGPRSYAAGQRVVDLARHGMDVVLLLSGGASSMMEVPVLDEADHRALMEDLVEVGLDIRTLNAARSLVSDLKAGGLAGEVDRAGGRLTVLFVSDVPDDDPGLVGSGPGSAVEETELVSRLDDLDDDLRDRVLVAADHRQAPRATAEHRCVLPRRAPMEAALETARSRGLEPTPVRLDGPVEQAADRLAKARPEPDEVVVAWGEPHVALPDDPGRGGRATHLVCRAWRELDADHVLAVAATDGVDGRAEAAGGYARPATDRSDAAVDAAERTDSATFLQELPPTVGGLLAEQVTHANSADVGVLTYDPGSTGT